jgi:nicotinamide-nucleotide amidase
MNAILLSIGDELVTGLTVNTNSAWLAEQLATVGIRISAHITVGDDLSAVTTAIREACDQLELEKTALDPPAHPDHKSGGILIVTGGLGPTGDDITRRALADALNQQLVEDPDAMLQIERFFKLVNRPMSPSNRLQALRPHEATVLENPVGTAPGLHAKKDHTDIFVLPGVPREMRDMFTAEVLPLLVEKITANGGAPTITHTLKINTFGRGESIVGEKIQDLMARTPSSELRTRNSELITSVGTTVHDGIVSIRIYATGAPADADEALARLRAVVYDRLGPLIFSEGDITLEAAVAQVLKDHKYTLATAESCTGGLLATLLTNTPGSSAYFLRGWITYANSAKQDDLAIPADLIAQHGAVSEPVARAMAQSARKFAEADFALATTGIAGPDGGTPEKPVGTVWIALAASIDNASPLTHKYIFPGNRAQIRLRAAQTALALLRWKLLGIAPP